MKRELLELKEKLDDATNLNQSPTKRVHLIALVSGEKEDYPEIKASVIKSRGGYNRSG
jgi:hypothetical protein